MTRGYRGVIFAACWLILSAQHPNPDNKAQQEPADVRIGDALQNIAATYDDLAKEAKSSPLDRQCDPGEDQRESDLCAQWKAADAAEKAAEWAAFAGWFGGLSFLGVLAALGLAFHSNWIARDTAKRQLRAYIVMAKGNATESGSTVYAKLTILNCGQTPARNIIAGREFQTFEGDKPIICGSHHLGSLGAAQEIFVKAEFDLEGPEHIEDRYLLFAGFIEYDDVFGDRHRTNYCLRRCTDGTFEPHHEGNSAT